ncbi:MAG: cobalt ECF transporter T component CbiQ [Oscillospiraceae bacterium]|nr:cobalt ECF transporter T component CbiQ [Oscillospiraceae bacterium]
MGIPLADVQTLAALEQLAQGSSPLHRAHPAAKLLCALALLGAVLSFDRYAVGPLVPYLVFPCVAVALADIPPGLLFRRAAPALPFCLLAGLSALALDRGAAFTLLGLAISRGAVSCAALLLRAGLCVATVLVLVAVTPLTDLTAQLRRFHLPGLLTALLELTYRYLGLLTAEARALSAAYALRAGQPRFRGVALSHMGSLVGSLFVRSADRAERVYAAMRCRGYDAAMPPPPARSMTARDWALLLGVAMPCALFRLMDVPALLGQWMRGWLV